MSGEGLVHEYYRKGLSFDISPAEVVGFLLQCVRNKKPCAVVRFGEGESRLLEAKLSDKFSMEEASRKLKRQTGLNFPALETLKIREMVLHALDEADVVGIRGDASFNPEHSKWMDRIEKIFERRVLDGRKAVLIAHCFVNYAISAALNDILRDQKNLSIVSCRNLKDFFEKEHNIENVAVYQIPSQYIKRKVDDDYEISLHNTPIWPDFYKGLLASIRVREPGEIFLVGAGLFGKELCIHVKNQGGIALDMGSTLDKMANKATRVGVPEILTAR
jgi:hypothetical protein